MRFATLLSALAASASLIVAPLALAQSTAEKVQQAKPAAAAATKSAPKAADVKPAAKVDSTAARTTPLAMKAEKSYEGCSSKGKLAASDL